MGVLAVGLRDEQIEFGDPISGSLPSRTPSPPFAAVVAVDSVFYFHGPKLQLFPNQDHWLAQHGPHLAPG